jgi:hypothetical protein
MDQTNRALIASNTPLRLTVEEMDAPSEVVRAYFQVFDLESCREILWVVVSHTICADDEDLGIDVNRHEVLTFYEETERLIEAVHLISQSQKGKP